MPEGNPEANKDLIRRYYGELWNRWDERALDELISPDIQFRGSLGATVSGREGFRGYVAAVRAAFPDFHNRVDELIAEDGSVLARLTYTGTHLGELYGTPPTGRRVEYGGLALFHISQGQVVSGLVYGDNLGLMRQIGASPDEVRR